MCKGFLHYGRNDIVRLIIPQINEKKWPPKAAIFV